MRVIHKLYTFAIIPVLGWIFSRDSRAYKYLPASVAAVPQGLEMCRILESAGFVNVDYRELTGGVCIRYTGFKLKNTSK